jgi:MoaA/NifB/PqqE/SkfB family radical SAM enzyme
MTYSVMYRGHLTSCNYSCSYCPFAKRFETPIQLQRDKTSLQRFVDWMAAQTEERWKILFTPWGEALVRPWYRDALIELSHRPNVVSTTIQTNLSCNIDWIQYCNRDDVGFWATLHPTEVTATAFISKVVRLREWGVRLSVGMVAVPEFLDQIEEVRNRLPADVYMWLNAQQPRSKPYTDDQVSRLTMVDPHFRLTLRRERSFGKPCRTGETTFTVDGNGHMRRCHFVDEVIGNIYTSNWRSALQPRNCANQFCDCFLGKAQLQAEELWPFFGDRLLERTPMN